jgi:Asp-tRNA(Asn)/Glu-tRNA(Gln) amidotransferase A subunit family amidase
MGNPKKGKWKTFREQEQKLCNQVLSTLRKLGVNLKPLDIDLPDLGTGFILTTEAAAAFEEFSRGSADDLVKKSHWPDTFRHRRFIPAVEYIQANRYRMILVERMNEIMKHVDVFVEVAHSNTQLTNLTGHPAVIVPCGFIDRRPVAIVFVGKLFGEAETLAVAKAYQDATDFHLKYPALSV